MSQKQLEKKNEAGEKTEKQNKWVEDEDVSDDAEVVKLEVGESIAGLLLEKKPSDIFGFVYKIKVADQELPKIVCGTTILNKKMAKKEIGAEVLIERLADQKTKKGRFVHDYKTYHKDQDNYELKRVNGNNI